jgi:hypothetical protein
MSEQAIIISEQTAILPTQQENAQQAIERQLAFVSAINQLIDLTFKEGIHYATIPGTSKPTLMLPGIEMARGLLGVREEFRDIHVIREFDPDNPFFYYEVECVLIHIHTGLEVGRGQAICHTREKSFMRQASRVCPHCGEEAIIKGKEQYGGGWLCWQKKGGCGAKFKDGDESIESQKTGMVNDSQQVWDGLNRARKIANKRAKADAIKNAAMLSEKFTVDLEDTLTVDYAPSTPSPETIPYEPPTPTESTPTVYSNKNTKPEPPTVSEDDTTQLWQLIFNDKTLLELYGHKNAIKNTVNKYFDDPLASGFDAVKTYLIQHAQEKANANPMDAIPE